MWSTSNELRHSDLQKADQQKACVPDSPLCAAETTEGKPVDAIFWSLQIQDEYLIGQHQPLDLE